MKIEDQRNRLVVHTGENADILNIMEAVLSNYDTIKEQRDNLLGLLTLWLAEGATIPMTVLLKDSYTLIKKINEQIGLEDV